MRVIPESDFLAWLQAGGIVPHQTWGTLVCAANPDLSRFWFPSFVASDLPGFIGTAVSALSSTGPYYLFRRRGGLWYDPDPATSPGGNVLIDAHLRAAGVPSDATGALCLDATEWVAWSLIILGHYVHGWSIDEDLQICSEERDCILMTSHHGELHVQFSNEARLESFRLALLAEGYDLPARVPDETYKIPAWLTGRHGHGAA